MVYSFLISFYLLPFPLVLPTTLSHSLNMSWPHIPLSHLSFPNTNSNPQLLSLVDHFTEATTHHNKKTSNLSHLQTTQFLFIRTLLTVKPNSHFWPWSDLTFLLHYALWPFSSILATIHCLTSWLHSPWFFLYFSSSCHSVPAWASLPLHILQRWVSCRNGMATDPLQRKSGCLMKKPEMEDYMERGPAICGPIWP